MRQVVWSMSVSLDGFMEGPNREIDWHRVDDELLQHFNDEFRGAGAFLEGRVTYELMAEFWPTADADPATPAPVAEFARIWRGVPKIVYSRTLEHADGNATIVRDVIPEEVRALQAPPGGDLVVGGANLAATFLEHDLIDEIRVYVHPVVLGRGKPMFRRADTSRALHLEATRTFGNGVVMLRYAVSHGSAAG